MLATLMPEHLSILFSPLFLLWLGVGGILVWGFVRLRDTTLAWPFIWCVGAWLLFTYAMLTSLSDTDFPNYVAAVAMIMPTLALLGAKRPQNGAWQFIVITLVGVLLFPVLKGYAFGDYRTHVHSLFRWLIAVHIVVGVGNYLPTRYAVPAVLIGVAQTCVCSPYLPFAFEPIGNPYLIAIFGTMGGCYSAAWLALRGPTSVPLPGMNRLWRDFRDAFGVVWGLRIAERLNTAARKHRWPVEFTWSGIIADPHSELRGLNSELLLARLDPDVRHRIEREMRSHLRRFVSHEWIVCRLTNDASSSSEPRT